MSSVGGALHVPDRKRRRRSLVLYAALTLASEKFSRAIFSSAPIDDSQWLMVTDIEALAENAGQ